MKVAKEHHPNLNQGNSESIFITLELRRLREEDSGFKESLGYVAGHQNKQTGKTTTKKLSQYSICQHDMDKVTTNK
jgi:hypothetical protein